jgi:MinD superfamily P-loop ATPase
MNIAIASGKGGTGKTTVATNLALYLADTTEKVQYIDCDVEEPNGHLFLNPHISEMVDATIPVPDINVNKCNACGKCVSFCQYRALVRLGKSVLVYPELCHGCGGCTLICPNSAISEIKRTIGTVKIGMSTTIKFVDGHLNIGEAMSPPLIRNVLNFTDPYLINIIDSPPGTSCPVIASIRNADFVLLVTEPTPFGLHDLGLALDMIDELHVPHAVLINRSDMHNTDAENFCNKRNVMIAGKIPDDRRIAEAYSKGKMIINEIPEINTIFQSLWERILMQVKK